MKDEPSYEHWEIRGKAYWPTQKIAETLPPGFYEIGHDTYQTGKYYFTRLDVTTDGLLRFPDADSDTVIDEIARFWESESRFRIHKLVFKRGILLFGPPGSGKSATLQLVCRDVIDRGGIVLKLADSQHAIGGFRTLRQIQPDVPVVVLIEDIDALMEGEQPKVTALLNLLDGVDTPEKVVFLATTNYPEKLERRIANRPSRFDKRFRIGPPSHAGRRMYFNHLCNGENSVDMEKWVNDTDGLSISHLKELFVQVVVLDVPYAKALKTLRDMAEKIPAEPDYEPGKVGFAKPDDEMEKAAKPPTGPAL